MKTGIKLLGIFIALYASLALVWYVAFDLVGVSNKFVAPYIYTILCLPPAVFVVLFIKDLINKISLKSVAIYVVVGIILAFVTYIFYSISFAKTLGPIPTIEAPDHFSDFGQDIN